MAQDPCLLSTFPASTCFPVPILPNSLTPHPSIYRSSESLLVTPLSTSLANFPIDADSSQGTFPLLPAPIPPTHKRHLLAFPFILLTPGLQPKSGLRVGFRRNPPPPAPQPFPLQTQFHHQLITKTGHELCNSYVHPVEEGTLAASERPSRTGFNRRVRRGCSPILSERRSGSARSATGTQAQTQ